MALDKPLGPELVIGIDHGAAVYPQSLRQPPRRREPPSFGNGSLEDQLADLLGDLQVDRGGPAPIQLYLHRTSLLD